MKQHRKLLAAGMALAMLLSCMQISAFAADTLTKDDFTLAVTNVSDGISVTLSCGTQVTGWGGGGGTLAVTDEEGEDASSYFTLTDVSAIGDDDSEVGDDWAWSATAEDETKGDTVAAGVWATYTFTVRDEIPVGDYTFTMTFTEDENFNAELEDYGFSGQSVSATYAKKPLSSYTVTLSDGVNGKATVGVGETVTMTVTVSGAAFNGMEAEITYDSSLFELKSVVGVENYDSSTEGAVSMYLLSAEAKEDGCIVATLTFTSKAIGTGLFTIADATADDAAGFAGRDSVTATLVGDTVEVKDTAQYTITIAGSEHGKVLSNYSTSANAGDQVTLSVYPDTGYELDALTVTYGENGTVEVGDGYTFTMPSANVTITATFKLIQYTVTLPADGGLTGEGIAQYGYDYVITIADYKPARNDYVVTITIGDEPYTDFTISETGTITIPGSVITGNIAAALTVTEKEIIATTVAEYVTGYTLVLVEAKNDTGYTYNGNAMLYVEAYEQFAYLVQGTADTGLIAAAASDAVYTTIDKGYDVNATGTVDFNDAGAAFMCYNVSYDVATYMAMYLRADVDGDKKVDTTDVSEIMDHYTADAEPNGE